MDGVGHDVSRVHCLPGERFHYLDYLAYAKCYLRVDEMDCMVTPPDDLPPAAESVRYTDIGKAYLKCL